MRYHPGEPGSLPPAPAGSSVFYCNAFKGKSLYEKTIAFLLTLAVMAGLLALPASAAGFTPPFDVAAPGAYVVNLDTNIIVYEKTASRCCPPPAPPR